MTGFSFVNRVTELAALTEEAERAGRGDPRVVQLTGPAGMGKSALAEVFLETHPELTRVMVAGAEVEAGVHLGVADTLMRCLAARAGNCEPLPGR